MKRPAMSVAVDRARHGRLRRVGQPLQTYIHEHAARTAGVHALSSRARKFTVHITTCDSLESIPCPSFTAYETLGGLLGAARQAASGTGRSAR